VPKSIKKASPARRKVEPKLSVYFVSYILHGEGEVCRDPLSDNYGYRYDLKAKLPITCTSKKRAMELCQLLYPHAKVNGAELLGKP
jgi:hypothetical protein